jgi:hypothetical protein
LIHEFFVEAGNREQGTGNREQGTGKKAVSIYGKRSRTMYGVLFKNQILVLYDEGKWKE